MLVNSMTVADRVYQVIKAEDKYKLHVTTYNGKLLDEYPCKFDTELQAQARLNFLYLQGKLTGGTFYD